MMKTVLGWVVAVALVMCCEPSSASLTAGGDDFEVLQLRPNFYVLAGPSGNVAVQIGEDGIIVVDAGPAVKADAVLAATKAMSARPIRYVIDTSSDSDRVGGNEKIAKAGRTLFIVNNALGEGMTNGGAAAVLAAEKVLVRMSAPAGHTPPYPPAVWPTETFNGPRKYMFLNGEGIEVLHLPDAHTDGDSVVFFRRSDIVVAGNILDLRRFPVIDLARGGSVQGEIDALTRIVDLAIPSVPIVTREGGTLVIPGNGRVCDQFDVVEYRDMVVIIRDRIHALIKAGKTLEQVKASSPASGFTRRYGSNTGPWTTDMFVEAVYKSLKEKKS
jgi:glyoxylase-like metal-dependent hydrolase (beta-lactamase superfamily II)